MGIFTPLDSNATIGSSERSIVGDTTAGVPLSSTTNAKVRVILDLAALAAGDEFTLTYYSKVDGGTQRAFEVVTLVGTYTTLYVGPQIDLYDGWDITLKKVAGTDRAIRWAVIQDVRDDVVVVNSTLAGLSSTITTISSTVDSIFSSVSGLASGIASLPSASEIADTLLAATVEGSVTVGRALRGLIRTAFAARRSGYNTGTVVVRDIANSKNSHTIVLDDPTTPTGWTSVTLTDLD